MIKYSLLFLTWNRLGVTARCFRSIAATLRRPDVEWRIIDSGSTDGTAEWVLRMANRYPERVHVTLLSHNPGVAGGREILFGQAQGEIIISMDSDVEARDPNWLEQLVAPLDDPTIGICGPAGHWILPNWEWYQPVPFDYVGHADVVSGYCQVFRRDLLARGCALDMYYNPYWHEDSDLCLQIKALGYDVWCVGDVGLYHIYAGTGADDTGHTKQAYLANKWRGKGLIRAEREQVENAAAAY